MTASLSNEQVNDFLTKPTGGEGLGAFISDEQATDFLTKPVSGVDGLGGETYVKTKTGGVIDYKKVNIPEEQIESDKGTQTFDLNKSDSGTQTSSGFVMPKWGWPAIIGVVVIGGYFIFKR